MEGKCMKMAFVMVMFVLGMCTELSSARYGCYDKCIVKCAAEKGRSAKMVCPAICYNECGNSNTVTSARDYCKIGCAVSTCLNGSTLKGLRGSPRGNEVVNCMNSVCAEKCNV
ncbi:hypothetical protein MKX03_012543 [Papaver bracteatum]|nr:hypothetical protein MKX03_012543 [Papaver bracteatum]